MNLVKNSGSFAAIVMVALVGLFSQAALATTDYSSISSAATSEFALAAAAIVAVAGAIVVALVVRKGIRLALSMLR